MTLLLSCLVRCVSLVIHITFMETVGLRCYWHCLPCLTVRFRARLQPRILSFRRMLIVLPKLFVIILVPIRTVWSTVLCSVGDLGLRIVDGLVLISLRTCGLVTKLYPTILVRFDTTLVPGNLISALRL